MKKGIVAILGVLLFCALVALILKLRPEPSHSSQNQIENSNSELNSGVSTETPSPNSSDQSPPIANEFGTSEIRVYTWANYANAAVNLQFEQEVGVKVKEEYFDSNEALRSQLQTGSLNLDVIVPSDFSMQQLISQNLLAELDMATIVNMHHISAKFLNQYFDPQNKFSVPFSWGTTGLGYNSNKIEPSPSSWADIFEPQRLSNLTNRVSMLDDARESVGAALKYLGYSLNTRNSEELAKAREVLIRQKSGISRYDSDNFRDFLLGGDLFLAHGWSGEIARAHAQHPEIKYVVPKEGGTLWADNLAIPKNSKHKRAAEAYINFLLRPQIAAQIVNELKIAVPNESATSLIKPEILADSALFPPADIFNKLEWIQDVGEAAPQYEKIWSEIKTK